MKRKLLRASSVRAYGAGVFYTADQLWAQARECDRLAELAVADLRELGEPGNSNDDDTPLRAALTREVDEQRSWAARPRRFAEVW